MAWGRGRRRRSSALDPHRVVRACGRRINRCHHGDRTSVARRHGVIPRCGSTFGTPSPATATPRPRRKMPSNGRTRRTPIDRPTVKGPPPPPLSSKRLSWRLTFDVDNKPVEFYEMNYLILHCVRRAIGGIYRADFRDRQIKSLFIYFFFFAPVQLCSVAHKCKG